MVSFVIKADMVLYSANWGPQEGFPGIWSTWLSPYQKANASSTFLMATLIARIMGEMTGKCLCGDIAKRRFSQTLFQRVKADVLEPLGHFPCPYIAKVSLEGKKSELEHCFFQQLPLFALNFQI